MDTIIYGMGGGNMSDPRMAEHYQRIVDLAKAQFDSEKPQVAIIPTAHFNGAHSRIGRGYMDFTVERFRGLDCDTQLGIVIFMPSSVILTRVLFWAAIRDTFSRCYGIKDLFRPLN